jgi:hypothetical protein
MLSIAVSVFFPEVEMSPSFSHRLDGSATHAFTTALHPRPDFHDAELRMLQDSARAATEFTRLAAKVITPSSPFGDADVMQHGGAVYLGWNLVRVDIVNMSVIVNHHFDYERDGHSRKYALHCEQRSRYVCVSALRGRGAYGRRSGAPEVYLIRSPDGFRIPYDTLDSVTLIALLRMGLLSGTKDRFYDLFLKMPLFEDMAPWNIGALSTADSKCESHCL